MEKTGAVAAYTHHVKGSDQGTSARPIAAAMAKETWLAPGTCDRRLRGFHKMIGLEYLPRHFTELTRPGPGRPWHIGWRCPGPKFGTLNRTAIM
eukprot:767294-Hanusia_phi.AAC.5